MKASDLEKLSVKERLEAMEILWNSFEAEAITIESPAWHGDVLQARKEKVANGTAKFITLAELKATYRAKD